jgi:Ca2+-binding EF-hand superfamily protein
MFTQRAGACARRPLQLAAARAARAQPPQLARAAVPRRARGLAGGGAADTSTLYGRMMARNPLLTCALTGSLLWSTGDLVAQLMESRHAGGGNHSGDGHGSFPVDDFTAPRSLEGSALEARVMTAESPLSLDLRRVGGTVVHGALVGGCGTFLWYNLLDKVVRNTLRLAPGSFAFVMAKLGLEIAVWHPTSLLAYWTIVGTAQGHEPSKIAKELHASFLSTLIGDAALWLPIDILCFSIVPVSMQTLFANCGSFIESVALSYVHEHGLDIFALTTSAAPAASSSAASLAHATGARHVGVGAAAVRRGAGAGAGAGLASECASESEEQDDTLREAPSVAGSKYTVLSKAAQQLLSIGSEAEDVVGKASQQFDALDTDKDGKLSLGEIRQAKDRLPGVEDKVVAKVVLSLITRKLTSKRAAEPGAEAAVSKAEYVNLIGSLHGSGYRKSRLLDVVFDMFDADSDGAIDSKELGQLLMVCTGSVPPKGLLDEIMSVADRNKDGRISHSEFVAFMEGKHQARVALR